MFVPALVWVLWRRTEILRTEIALCWLGMSLVLAFLTPLEIVTPAARTEGFIVGTTLVFVSPVAWVLWRRAEIMRTELALYWPGLSLAITFAMGVYRFTLFGLNERFNPDHSREVLNLFDRSWFYGAVIAALIGMMLLTVWRRRPAL